MSRKALICNKPLISQLTVKFMGHLSGIRNTKLSKNTTGILKMCSLMNTSKKIPHHLNCCFFLSNFAVSSKENVVL